MRAGRGVGMLVFALHCAGAALAQPGDIRDAVRNFERAGGASFPIAHEDQMRRELEDGAHLCLPVSRIDCLEMLGDTLKRFPDWLADNGPALARYRDLQGGGAEVATAAKAPPKPAPSRLPKVHALHLLKLASLHAAGDASGARKALDADIRFLRNAVGAAATKADKELLASLLERDYALLDSMIDAAGKAFGAAGRGDFEHALRPLPAFTAAMLPRLDDLAAYIRVLGEKADTAAGGEPRRVAVLDGTPPLGPRVSWNASTWSYEFRVGSDAWLQMAALWRDQPPRAQVQMPEHVPLVQPEFRGIRAYCTSAACTLRSGDGRAVTARKGLKLEAAFGDGKGKGKGNDGLQFAVVEAVRAPGYVDLGLILQRRDGNWIGPLVRLPATR